MEKVLRKVKCSERLPIISGNYFVKYFSGELGTEHLYNSMDHYDIGNFDRNNPEYWYEEVPVDELEDYKIVVGNLNMIIEMDTLKSNELVSNLIAENQGLKLAIERNNGGNCVIAPYSEVQKIAKERYKKALKYIDDYHNLVGMNVYIETSIVLKALKIAAGLNEEEI